MKCKKQGRQEAGKGPGAGEAGKKGEAGKERLTGRTGKAENLTWKRFS